MQIKEKKLAELKEKIATISKIKHTMRSQFGNTSGSFDIVMRLGMIQDHLQQEIGKLITEEEECTN